MKPKSRRAKDKFEAMNAGELVEATEAYGQEMVIDKFAPLRGLSRERWKKARRKRGRPRRGKGAKVISVSVERELLSRSDSLAKDLGVSRAGLIERGLKAVLAAEGKL